MKFINVAWLGVAFVSVAALADTARAQGCDCTKASLMGDTVAVQRNGGGVWPIVNSTVGTTVELPSTDLSSSSGATPRFKIDYGANTIRIDFITRGPATYGANANFTFTNLNPKLAQGCAGAPYISGMTVTTNKSGVGYVLTGSSFGPDKATVVYGPPSGTVNWNPGEYILATFTYKCDTTPTNPPAAIDPCCPPWNSDMLKSMLFYQGTGNISDPYTLRFQPSNAFKQQIQAYINYLNAVNPAITTITIHFAAYDAGNGASPGSGTGQVGSNHWVSWTAGGNGNPSNGAINLFGSGIMQTNRWYQIHTGIYLENKQAFFPESCANNDTYVRIQTQNMRLAPDSQPPIEYRSVPSSAVRKSASVDAGMLESEKTSEETREVRPVLYRPGDSAPNDNEAAFLNAQESERVLTNHQPQ